MHMNMQNYICTHIEEMNLAPLKGHNTQHSGNKGLGQLRYVVKYKVRKKLLKVC